MADFLLFGFLILLIIAANVVTRLQDRSISQLFFLFLCLLNILLFVFGLLFAVLPEDQLTAVQPAAEVLNLQNPLIYGIIFQLMAVWGILVTVPSSRQSLFKNSTINPHSPVHMLALLLAGYLIGNVGLIFSQGGLDQIAQGVDAATIGEILSPALLFLSLAFFGVGFVIRRDWRETMRRLGLERPTWKQLRLGIRWMFGLVLLQWLVGALWAAFNPEQAAQLSDINNALLDNIDTVWEWLILALAAGVGEEILFRGALQPVLGLPFTAVLFAVGHVQYGLTPVTLLILVLGLVLGIIRRQTNTTVAIAVHFGYNFILGLLALSLPYLERWAEQAARIFWSVG